MRAMTDSRTSFPVIRVVFLGLIAVGIAAAGAVLFLAGDAGARRPQGIEATYLPGGKPVTDFQLTDQNGKPFSLETLKEGWHFLFFGYTHCPDVCPTTLATMNVAWQQLQTEGLTDNAQVVFISVDPGRDSLARLAEYVPYFNEDFLGVTGDPKQIKRLTGDLGVLYAVHDDEGDDNYNVDHSAAILLINPRGQLQALFKAPHDAGTIARDFKRIRRFYEGHS
jgi:protein SCO1/2